MQVLIFGDRTYFRGGGGGGLFTGFYGNYLSCKIFDKIRVGGRIFFIIGSAEALPILCVRYFR